MLASDVPLWFATIALVVPVAASLVTLVLTQRHATKEAKRAAAERAKERDHANRSDAWRSLRPERIVLYRKLVQAGGKLLNVDQPLVPAFLELQEAVAERRPPKHGPTVGDLDEWNELATEANLIGGPAVAAAAQAVKVRYDELWRRDFHRQLAKKTRAEAEEREEPPVIDLDESMNDSEESKQRIAALIEVCRADIASLHD